MSRRLCGGGPCDYCVSPSPRKWFFGFLRLGLDFGQDFGPVGTGDLGLGLGLDNYKAERTWAGPIFLGLGLGCGLVVVTHVILVKAISFGLWLINSI